ncbi:helix-turn-helix domain-containing protein [Thioalkalivibrio sp. ALMg13-2]|uniref:helix-turn-helix domain-containing protein n=1 Tax=Thioalkalivibrio sp. ALMg13-2 TaxID=1158167 RepID=UPI0005704528
MARLIDLNEISDRDFVDKGVVARCLGLSVRTVETLTSKRELPVYKFGSSVRYRFGEILEWAEQKRL